MHKETIIVNIYINDKAQDISLRDSHVSRAIIDEFLSWFENGSTNIFKLKTSEKRTYYLSRNAIKYVEEIDLTV